MRLEKSLGVIAMVLAATACSVIEGLDHLKVDPAGQGGAGGSSATGPGPTTSSVGPGGGAGCQAAIECPKPIRECVVAACDNHLCATIPAQAGTPVATQHPGTCQRTVCDGNGFPRTEVDPSNVRDDNNPCTDDKCLGAHPVNPPSPARTLCGNGNICDGHGQCVQCLDAMDCAGGLHCTMHTCAPASCNDQVKDGSETDVDCGGTCPPCADGRSCLMGTDCTSGDCGMAMACLPPSCTDKIKNGTETGVDCGGTCGACDGGMCASNGECASSLCFNGICEPAACNDMMKDNGETGVDCSGPCVNKCPAGQGCLKNTDCVSNVCVGVVCN